MAAAVAVATPTAARPRTARKRRLLGVVTWLLALGLATGWAVYLRPASLGGPAGYVIVSGESMEPLLHTGDLAIVRRSADYEVGDVVAYRIPKDDVGGGSLVIHRVIGGSAHGGLVLQGDNRDTVDMWRPRSADVVGRLQWYIPHAGTGLFLLRTPLVIAGVVGFLGFWIVATSPDKRREAEDDAPAGAPVPSPSAPPPQPVPAIPAADRSAAVAATAVVALSVGSYVVQRRRATRRA